MGGRLDVARGVYLPDEGDPVSLTTREVELLAFLVARDGEVVSRDVLLREVWGYHEAVVSRAVDRTVARLRAKLESDPSMPPLLVTVHGDGYRWVGGSTTALELAAEAPAAAIVVGEARVDLARLSIERGDGERVPLTPTEAALLKALAARAGQVLSPVALRGVWGRVPSATALHNAVSRLRRKLGDDPAAPRWLHTVRAAGLRLDLAPAPAVPRPVGRYFDAGLVGSLAALVEANALVCVVGPGGIGKTRLLLELAGSAPARPSIWCDLAEVVDEPSLAAAMRLALGHGVQRVGAALAARGSVLVLIDNVERAVGPLRAALDRWRGDAPAARFVVASRVRLEHPDERVVRVEPLPHGLAVALLRDRAAAVTDPGEALAKLADALDRLPLALELAAATLGVCTPAELLERLEARLDLLAQEGRGRRHASLRDVLAQSWELLSPALRDALARLAVFRGGFRLDAAEAVLGDDALARLRGLEAHSLVSRQEGRFRLLDAVRLFAAERAVELGLSDETSARHQAWYARFARELRVAEPRGFTQPERIAAELPNLVAAAVRGGATDADARALVDALEGPLHAQRAYEMLDEVIAAALAVNEAPAARARLLAQRANTGFTGHHIARARVDAADALALADGDPVVCAKARTALALMAVRSGRWDEALTEAEAALAEARASGVSGLVASALSNLAMTRRGSGDGEGAVEALVEALPLAPTPHVRGTILLNLGNATAGRGDIDEAEAQARAALDCFPGRERLDMQGRCHGLLADVHWLRGAHAEALAALVLAERAHRDEGAPDAVALVLRRRARVLAAAGRLDEALATAEAGLRESPPDARPIRGALNALAAGVLWRLGRPTEAGVCADLARGLLGDEDAAVRVLAAHARGEALPEAADHDALALRRMLLDG